MGFEATRKLLDNKTTVKIVAADVKELFQQLADLTEIFEATSQCGNKSCGSSDLRPSVRTDKEGNKYYEFKCTKCGYSFKFGQHKKGGSLFPKYSEGWSKYVATEGEESATPAPKNRKVTK
jgi:hypothetical protein